MSQSDDAGHKTRHDGSVLTIGACPECGTAETNVYPRREKQSTSSRKGDPTARYVCNDCGAQFDELDERERGPGGGHRKGTLAKTLLDADPDAVGGDA
jgi:transposase-like protein